MKLLDEKGIGTVWSICKEKFALTGHTHNYAGSGSPGGSANSAIGVVDYNQTGKTIQIGYSGNGITGDQIKYIAGYTDGSGNVNAKIKDVSKDALKSWLGLDLFVRNVDAVTDVTFSTNVNTNDIQLDVEKADGTVVNVVVPEATEFNNGIISKEDKVKLNGIAAGANNYTLPTASDTTLGGIKVSTNVNGTGWPICVDENGLAETKINGLTKINNGIKYIILHGNGINATSYSYNAININYNRGDSKLISLPSESGTLALTSDIPTKTSQLTNDSGFLNQRDFECTINISLIDTQLSSDEFKGANITIEQQGEDVMYAIWGGSPISFTADAKTKIKISVSHVDGYITPNAVEFKTAIGIDEDITFTYVPAPLGVYICDTDNKLTLPDKWNSSNNYKAVGVYIGTENSQFVIAPTSSKTHDIVWSYSNKTISGIVTSTDSAVAKKDYAGKTNTNKIIAQLDKGDAPAAEYCRNYTFKNGKKGYLWSLGEAQDAYNNKAAIDAALVKIGGSDLPGEEGHWTSTQYNNYRVWKKNWHSGDYYNNKDYKAYVRAVCTI